MTNHHSVVAQIDPYLFYVKSSSSYYLDQLCDTTYYPENKLIDTDPRVKLSSLSISFNGVYIYIYIYLLVVPMMYRHWRQLSGGFSSEEVILHVENEYMEPNTEGSHAKLCRVPYHTWNITLAGPYIWQKRHSKGPFGPYKTVACQHEIYEAMCRTRKWEKIFPQHGTASQ